MKKIGILVLLIIVLIFFFWPGYPPNQFLQSLLSGKSPQQQKQAFNVLPSLVKAEFANSVTEEDKGFVITGISAMDFYLQKWFGKSINKPAGLRVGTAAESPSSESEARVGLEGGKIVILIKTGGPIWKQMIELNKYGGESRNRVSAHEYVHVYQFHNGCGTDADGNLSVTPKWFLEGEAEWLSNKAMHESGLVPSFGFPQFLLPFAKQETAPLKSYEKVEKGGLTVSRYTFYTIAIDYLMRGKPKKVLDDFCVNLADGKGMSMPKAFEAAFGISLEKFYEGFEAYRKTW